MKCRLTFSGFRCATVASGIGLAVLLLDAGAVMPTSQTVPMPKSKEEMAADALDSATTYVPLNPQDKKGVDSLAQGLRKGDNIIQYGNWYGPGWWGGGADKDKPGNLPPVDELDAAAQRHDFGYLVAEKMGKIYGKAEELRLKGIADAIAVRDAMRLDPDPSKWTPPAADPAKADRYRNRIITGFTYESSGYDAAGNLVLGADWVTSPIENYELDRSHQLDPSDLERQVTTLVNNWNRINPPDSSLSGTEDDAVGDADESENSTEESTAALGSKPPDSEARSGDPVVSEPEGAPESEVLAVDPETESKPDLAPEENKAADEETAPPEKEAVAATSPERTSGRNVQIDEGSGEPGDSSDEEETDADIPDTEEVQPPGADSDGSATETKGYVQGKDGSRVTLTETRNPDGTVTTTTTETDPDGNVISQTSYGESGEGRTTTPGGGLRGAEAKSDAEVDRDMATDGYKSADSYSANWTDTQDQRGTDGSMTMAQNAQMQESSNIGNQDLWNARATRDGGGRDAQATADAARQKSSKADRENSWGKAIGDAVESGITEGGKAFGQAMGQGAADRAVGEIFGSGKGDSGSAGGAGGAAPAQVASTAPSGSSSSGSGEKKPSAKTKPSGQSKPSSSSSGSSPSASSNNSQATSKPETAGSSSPPLIGHCPKCGRTDLVEHVYDRPNMTVHDWRCPVCDVTGVPGPPPPGLGTGSGSASGTAPAATPPANSAPPAPAPPPLAPKKTRKGCPVCKAPVTYSNDHYLYGSVYHCANGHTVKGSTLITVEIE